MKYVGSKARLAKDIVPIIQGYIDNNGITKYLEPFVGGANVINKIKCQQRVGCDKNVYLIDLLHYVSTGGVLPNTITREEYEQVRDCMGKFPSWYVGIVGFCASYNSKWFGGYANGVKTKIGTVRNYTDEAIRNLKNQQPSLTNIKFFCREFQTLHDLHDCVIYCDPPYRNTTKYATGNFDYEMFYDWCVKMAESNIVLISEYDIPDSRFECIWDKPLKCTLDKAKRTDKIERLYMVKGGRK